MVKPVRIQRKRTKGWKMPPNTVYVGRPSKFGNPFHVGQDGTAKECTALYEGWLTGDITDKDFRRGPFPKVSADWYIDVRPLRLAALPSLRGKNLCCWCPLDQPCHADILLEIANRDSSQTGAG